MSTYLEVQNRINNDYLNRTTFVSETKHAIQATIRAYERQRWDFNETATSMTTSAGQSFATFPSNFLILDDLRITISGENLPLNRRDPQWIREANTGATTGQPTDFALYQNRVELFTVPDSAYSLPVYYLKSLSTLSADADTNAWITGGMEDVIVYGAAKHMWASVLRNDKEAVKFSQFERDALMSYLSFREQRTNSGLRATRF